MGNNTFNFDEYFDQMQGLVSEKKSSARVRCLIMVCLFLHLYSINYISSLQDVIDLRKNNWIQRREDAGPKTIDQIHKEAQNEEMKQKLALSDAPPSRKSEDRSSQRRYFCPLSSLATNIERVCLSSSGP